MSEESKITSAVKVKDPRRVEAGKRLGMISKQAKERRARERSEAESQAHEAHEANKMWRMNGFLILPSAHQSLVLGSLD